MRIRAFPVRDTLMVVFPSYQFYITLSYSAFYYYLFQADNQKKVPRSCRSLTCFKRKS